MTKLPSHDGTKRRSGQSRKPQPAPSVPDGARWLKPAEVAVFLGMSRISVYRLHHRGQLPSFKLPGLGIRVDREKLTALLENTCQPR